MWEFDNFLRRRAVELSADAVDMLDALALEREEALEELQEKTAKARGINGGTALGEPPI